MKKRIFRYLKHIILTIVIIVPAFMIFSLLNGKVIKYDKNRLVSNWQNEGPYVFFENDSLLIINYIKGNKKDGFYVDSKTAIADSNIQLKCFYPLDSSAFSYSLNTNFEIPKSVYADNNKILAISDIESNYKTFRNFLISSEVIDKQLNWTFGENHLVLVGDFIDRSYFTTQVLWFIYKLEQDAKSKGGNVHFILGNHEIMNMQGNHKNAKSKYRAIASILDKKQYEFYSKESFLGRWMESKNTLEVINGNLFVHGGISPEMHSLTIGIDSINSIIRKQYFKSYYPKKDGNKLIQTLTSSKTSPYWYRGYYKKELSQKSIDKGLKLFNAKAVIVGHNTQKKVNKSYNGKVIGIDLIHPQDYYSYFFERHSEALLIENDKYFRVLDDGEKIEI